MSDKATQSEARTRSLYDEAVAAADTLRADLEPRIESAKGDVKQGRNSKDSKDLWWGLETSSGTTSGTISQH